MHHKLRTVTLAAAGVAAAVTLITAPQAHAYPVAATSWGAANLISYADSDFEGTLGDWVSSSNTTLTDDTTQAFLHKDSMKMTATAAGSQAAKMGTGTSAPQVNVTAGDKYRESAWVKAPALSGRTVTFADGFYTASGTWLGWTSGSAVTLKSTGTWQYVEGDITAPATAAYMVGSPRITEAGVAANETLNVDEVLVEPYRAATLIGAEDTSGDCKSFSAANTAIGPLQSCKVFYNPTTAIPSSWSASTCSDLPADVTCVLAYKDFASASLINDFVSTVPAANPVIFVYYQEPENPNDSFSYDGKTGASAFVAEFENQASAVHAAVAAYSGPGVFIADDSMDYQYAAGSDHNDGGAGGSCSFIVPASAGTGAPDFYLDDHYAFTTNGDNLATNTDSQSSQEWDGWLNCVSPQNKPIGLAEYGLNCGQTNGTGAEPNALTTSEEMSADNTYLAGEPAGLPVVMWEYWWDTNGYSSGDCQFTEGGSPDGSAAVTQWRANETQNGGGAN